MHSNEFMLIAVMIAGNTIRRNEPSPGGQEKTLLRAFFPCTRVTVDVVKDGEAALRVAKPSLTTLRQPCSGGTLKAW